MCVWLLVGGLFDGTFVWQKSMVFSFPMRLKCVILSYIPTYLCVWQWLYKLKSLTQSALIVSILMLLLPLYELVHGRSFGYTQLCIDVKLVSLNSCYSKYTMHTLLSFRSFECVCAFFYSFRFISNKFFSSPNQLCVVWRAKAVRVCVCVCARTYKLVFII